VLSREAGTSAGYNEGGLRTITKDYEGAKTPFPIYESPRKYSPAPLLMHIEDMNESGDYKILYDYWVNTYSEEQVEQRHEAVMGIVSQMVSNPEMKLESF